MAQTDVVELRGLNSGRSRGYIALIREVQVAFECKTGSNGSVKVKFGWGTLMQGCVSAAASAKCFAKGRAWGCVTD